MAVLRAMLLFSAAMLSGCKADAPRVEQLPFPVPPTSIARPTRRKPNEYLSLLPCSSTLPSTPIRR